MRARARMSRRSRVRRTRTRGAARSSRRAGGTSLSARVGKLERTQEETKHLIFTSSGVPGALYNTWMLPFGLSTTTQFQFCLNGVRRGVEVQKRIGDKAAFTRFTAKIACLFGTAIVAETWVRWALVCVKDNKGANLSDPTAAGGFFPRKYGTLAGIQPREEALPNINNYSQGVGYRVLKRGEVRVTNPNDATTETRIININWYNKGLVTDYSLGDTGGTADIDKNAIYLYFWTNNTIAYVTEGVQLSMRGEAQMFYHG